MPGMLVAPEPLAVEAGAQVLQRGGNAVDAALACAFVQGVVNPQMCGLGGYAIANVRLAGQRETRLLDAPAIAGANVSAEMWQDRILRPHPEGWGFFLRGKVNDVGYTAICTPGAVKAYAAMLERWGTWTWAQVIEPAVHIAAEGFTVGEKLAAYWRTPAAYPEESSLLDYVRANAEAGRIYLKPDGAPYGLGERIRNPDYARTLQHLAQHGPEDFYRGELARRISADLETNGSFVTAADLGAYCPRDVPPVVGLYRGYTLSTSQPPHGGPTLLALLNILEGYNLRALGHNSPDYIYRVSMAMKAAFADRNPALGDPAFVDVPLDWMISKERAAQWRARMDAGEPITVTFNPAGAPHTTHVSVIDAAGNSVALTHSLGASSGVITPGLGFMYNNSMVNFHPLPGHPNSIAPRKGRTTGMAPTFVFKDDQPVLIVGAPGASRIITGVAQVILNVLEFGMSVTEAVLAPRFDCQGELIRCQARIPEYVCAAVRTRHPIQRLAQSHGGMSLVQALAIDPITGALSGAADSGSEGMALAV